VSDLAEYAYCPRAQWYRTHPPRTPPSPTAVRSAARGLAYHEQRLAAVADREARGPGWGIAALILGLLLVAALVLVVLA
jgi:CRISPR/Cas system-associated exonuclease Cas4 (RecB family)